MNYEVRLDRGWRRRQYRGIVTVGGVGCPERGIEAGSAAEAAARLAAGLFGDRGSVVSCVFYGRTHAGGWRGIAGKVWRVSITARVTWADKRRVRDARAPLVWAWLTAGSVSKADMPVGRFPRRPVDPLGTQDIARARGVADAMRAVSDNLEMTGRELEESVARYGAGEGARLRVGHLRRLMARRGIVSRG